MDGSSHYAPGDWFGNPFASRSVTPVQNPFSSPEPRGADIRSNPFLGYKGHVVQEPLVMSQPGPAYHAAAQAAWQQTHHDISSRGQSGTQGSAPADAYFTTHHNLRTYPETAGTPGPTSMKQGRPLNAVYAAGLAANMQQSLYQQHQQAGFNSSVPYDQYISASTNQQAFSPQQQPPHYARSAAYAPQQVPQNPDIQVEMLSRVGSVAGSIPTAAAPEVTSPPGTPDSMSALKQQWQHIQQQQMLQDAQPLAPRRLAGARHAVLGPQDPPNTDMQHPAALSEQQWPSNSARGLHAGPSHAAAAAAYRPPYEQQPAYVSSSTSLEHSAETASRPTVQRSSPMGPGSQQIAVQDMPAAAHPRSPTFSSMQHPAPGGPEHLAGNGNAMSTGSEQYIRHQQQLPQQGQLTVQQQQHEATMVHQSQQLYAIPESYSAARVPGPVGGRVGSDHMPGTPFAASAAADRHVGLSRDSSSAGTTGGSTEGGLQMVVSNAAMPPAAAWQQDAAGVGAMMPAAAATRSQLMHQHQQQEQERLRQEQQRQAEMQRQAAAMIAIQQQQQQHLALLGLQTLQAAAAGGGGAANPLAAAAAGSPMFGGMMPLVPAMLAAPALVHPMYSPGMLMGQMPFAMPAAGGLVPAYNPWLDARVLQASAAAAAAAAGYAMLPQDPAPPANQQLAAGTAADYAAAVAALSRSMSGTAGGAPDRMSSGASDSLDLMRKSSAAGPLVTVRGLGQGLVMRAATSAANGALVVGRSTAAAAQSAMMAVVLCGHYQLVFALYIMLAMTASILAAQRAMWNAAAYAVNTALQCAGLTARELRLFATAAAKVAWADLHTLPGQLLDQPWLQLQQQGKGTEAALLVMQQLPAQEVLHDTGLLESFRGLLLLGPGAGGSNSTAASAARSLPAPATAVADTPVERANDGTDTIAAASTQGSRWSYWDLFSNQGPASSSTTGGLPDLAVPAAADGAAAGVDSTALVTVSSAGSVTPAAAGPQTAKSGTLLVAVDSVAVISGMWVGLGLKLWGLTTFRLPYETARVWGAAAWYGARMSLALSRATGYYVFRLVWCLLHISLILSAHARSHLQLPSSSALAAAVPIVQRVSAVMVQAVKLWWKHLGRPLLSAAGTQLVSLADVVPGGSIGVQVLLAMISICVPVASAVIQSVFSAVRWLWTIDEYAWNGSSIRRVVMPTLGVIVSAAVWFSTQVAAQVEKIVAALAAILLQGAPPMAQTAVWGTAGMLKRLVAEVSQQAWLLGCQMYEAWLLQQEQSQRYPVRAWIT